MIKSKFLLDIVDLLLDTHENESRLRQQLTFLQESAIDYSGAGVFISFDPLEGMEGFKIATESEIINGVKIESSELSIGAEASLFISKGIIDYLEIWSYGGDYPKHELTDYVLIQVWDNSPGKQRTSTN